MSNGRDEVGVRGALGVLVASALALAVPTAAVHVALLAQAGSVGRLRDLESVLLARRIFELFDWQLMSSLPAAANRLHELTSWTSLAAFTAQAVVTTAAGYLALAAVLAPLVIAGVYLTRRMPDARRRTLWRAAFPVGVLVAFAVPLYFPPLHRWLEGRRFAVVVAGLVVALLLAALLGWLFRRPGATATATRWLLWTGGGALGVALLLAVSLSGRATTRPPAPAGAPSILLVSIDTLRPDHLSAYGYGRETSPRIDAVAAEGALFETVLSTTTWTLPAHLTLLTGLPSEGHGVVDDGMRLGDEAVLLSEVLRDAGYATAGFVAGPYLAGSYGFLQGFDAYDDFTVARLSNRTAHHDVTSPTSMAITEEWLAEWDAAGRQRPFFIFLHLWDVHYDFVPPPPYDTMFDPGYTGTVTGEDFETGDQVHAGMDPRDLEHVIALYDGEIRFTDHHLGLLFDRLRELGVYDDLLLVITGDHGEEFFEHGKKGHRKSLYDETLRVPLIVRFPPKVPAGLRIGRQARLMDVAPTILSLAGVARPSGFAGEAGAIFGARDLSPLFDPAADVPEVPAFGDLYGRLKAVRGERAKLIRDLDPDGRYEVYDLAADPREQTDLGHAAPDLSEILDEELGLWLEAWASGGLSQATEIDDDLRKQLEALGYLD